MKSRYWLRAGLVGIAVLIAWAVYISSKQLTRNERIESEVEALRMEADKIRRENETLHEKISYFSTADFQEQEAKEKLGMKKEHEEVVVIKERPEEIATAPGVERKPARVTVETPPYRQWFELFFSAP
jgi:cell division protein FtsB